jgi:hypothetical protein
LEAVIRQPVNSIDREELVLAAVTCKMCELAIAPQIGDVLNVVLHQNIRLSGVVVSDILGSDHLSLSFHITDHVKAKNISKSVNKFTDWQRFQRFVSDLISPRIKINSEEKPMKLRAALPPLLLRRMDC